jgi:hypothetical protein
MMRSVCAICASLALAGLLTGCKFTVSGGNNAAPAANANANAAKPAPAATNSTATPAASPTAAPASGSSQTIAYPSKDHALFTVTAPGNWKLEPAEAEGGFFNLNAPTGGQVAFRSVPGTEDDLKAAIDETMQFVRDNFSDVQLKAPQRTPEGFFVTGSGKDKSSGSDTVFQMEWKVMKNGNIAEIWVAEGPDDDDDQLEAVIKSLKEI